MIATKPSSNIDPYPMGHAFHSREIILGVVPEEIKRMKSRNGAASDGDEDEGKDFAGKDGPGAIDEAREGWQLERGMHQQDADGQHRHNAQFDEGAQIIARRKEQPNRQRRWKGIRRR